MQGNDCDAQIAEDAESQPVTSANLICTLREYIATHNETKKYRQVLKVLNTRCKVLDAKIQGYMADTETTNFNLEKDGMLTRATVKLPKKRPSAKDTAAMVNQWIEQHPELHVSESCEFQQHVQCLIDSINGDAHERGFKTVLRHKNTSA